MSRRRNQDSAVDDTKSQDTCRTQNKAEAKAYLLIPDGVPHVEGVVLQGVLGFYPLLVSLIFALVLLSLLNHALNLVLAQAALVIGDRDLVLGAYTKQTLVSLCKCTN